MGKEYSTIILSVCCMLSLISCEPAVHNKYEYIVSGTVYTDKTSRKVVPNILVGVFDWQDADYTYGSSTFIATTAKRTDKDGHFCFTIHGGRQRTVVYAGGTYDVRGDSLITDDHLYLSPYTYVYDAKADTIISVYEFRGDSMVIIPKDSLDFNTLPRDSLFTESRLFYQAVCGNDVYHLEDMEIFLQEEGIMQVTPLKFSRGEKIKIILPQYVDQIIGVFLYDVERPLPFEPPQSYLAHKMLHIDNNSTEFVFNIPDSVVAGVYSLDVRCRIDNDDAWSFSRIVELKD